MLRKLRRSSNSFIIAEVGQNHQGSVATAVRYVDEFSKLGADAVKFQMRHNKTLFTPGAYNREYESENAFGKTYGEHREALELSIGDWKEVKSACRRNNVKFMCTPFDSNSLKTLIELEVDILKIASFDLGNLMFLEEIAAAKRPVVLSIGGGLEEHIDASINLLQERSVDLAVLHCVSEYPCPVEHLNLGKIEYLLEKYPTLTVGLSDHFNGILSGPVGYLRGARVFEKHVTFDRAQKGTDHSFSLEPKGFSDMVRDIRRVPKMSGAKPDADIGKEFVFQKLGKSIFAKRTISRGEVFTINNLTAKIDVTPGIPVRDSSKVIGVNSTKDYEPGDKLTLSEIN